MSNIYLRICVLAASLFAVTSPAMAQEIVHALTGTVSAIDPAAKTITIFHNGSTSTFNVMSSSNTRISFDKTIAQQSTAAKEFQKQGAYVVLFYFGMDQNKTAVALKPLGPGPLSSARGDVASWDGHDHTLVITGQDGKQHSFKVGSDTVAETYAGAVDGSDFRAGKGDHVRVVSTTKDGKPTALFIAIT